MPKRIIAYLLFILGLFTFAFFTEYKGQVIHYGFLFWLIGGAMWVGGFLLLRDSRTLGDEKKDKMIKEMIAELKANSKRITVNFSDCEIKENNYTETKRSANDDSALFAMIKPKDADIKMVEALAGYNTSDTVNVKQSVIVFPYIHDGKTETFVSRIIPKDKATLLFELTSKKTTTLYVDPNDSARYYFDLDFLNQDLQD